MDGGHETLRLRLPAVITADLRLNTPRCVGGSVGVGEGVDWGMGMGVGVDVGVGVSAVITAVLRLNAP